MKEEEGEEADEPEEEGEDEERLLRAVSAGAPQLRLTEKPSCAPRAIHKTKYLDSKIESEEEEEDDDDDDDDDPHDRDGK
ncbi:hypothetical protein BC827DRAFT_1379182 [Russula dissimulans]|nr:hypothetical protein BC827DRAFT_1379182 [Russula dissimulans]